MCLQFTVFIFLLLLPGCGAFPNIKNAEKITLWDAPINSTNRAEVSVKYVCNKRFVYSMDNPIVNCTENGFDNKLGKCVKGKIF